MFKYFLSLGFVTLFRGQCFSNNLRNFFIHIVPTNFQNIDQLYFLQDIYH